VDEYQDTNPPQYHLVRALSSVHGNLCVVGDEDQSIYRFRGADIGNILSFQNDFPGTTIVKLTQNYRSTSSILDAANALVRRNNQRIGKELWTDSGKGDDVRFTLLPGDRDEASFVLGQLQTWRLSGGVLENVAILYRTNAQSRLLEEALSDARIPYRIYGGLRFYDRREVRDLMAYLRLALNPADDVSFRRIVGVPPRGLGAAAMMAVEARATGGAGGQSGAAGGLSGAAGGLSGAAGGLSGAAGGLSGAAGGLSGAAGGLSGAAGGLSGAMAACVKEGRLPSRAAASAGAFLDLIEELREMAKTVTPAHLLRTIIARIDYEGYLRRNDPSDAESRLENVEQLVAAADEAGPDGLQSFLDRASLVSESESCTGDRGVNLMTLHSAKGLEFDVVFLVGLEEGLLPHSRTLEEESDIEEERRLCYVGMTRARRRLHLTAASYRRLYGEPAPSTVSRFIDEIGEENLRRMETPFTSWRREGVASLRRPGRQIALGDEDISRGGDDEDGEGSFGVGARVRHEQFGVGRVLAVEAAPQGQKLTVRFTGGRTMKVLTRYARLEPVRG
jgi:DNA helicase-2/ATP-dependent DNA helicase PcrA